MRRRASCGPCPSVRIRRPRALPWAAAMAIALGGEVRAMTTSVAYPFLGVTHTRIVTTVPRQLTMNLVEVDLAVQGIGFTVTPSNGSASGETVGRTTRQFATEKKTQVAVNGGFSLWNSGSNYVVEGLAADRGVIYSEFEEFRTFALNITADNVATILRATSLTGTTRTPDIPLYNVLPGEARLLRNSTIVQYANETLHPRTAVGLSGDARRLFVMTVDGRNTGHSLGVTRPELADFMRMFGATDAINLDGGGSTTLVFSETTPRIVNVPVGVNDAPGTERTVGSNFGIYALPVPPAAAVTVDVTTGTQTQAGAGHPLFVSTTSLAKSGRGTLVLDQANVFAAATTVRDGTLRIANSRALTRSPTTVLAGATLEVADGTAMIAPSLTIAGGTLSATRLDIGGTSGLGSLSFTAGALLGTPDITIAAGGTVSFAGPSRLVSIGTLAIDSTAGGGRLDIGSSRVGIARGFSAAAILPDLAAGEAGGWNGPTGIVSSTAAALGLRIGWRDEGTGAATLAAAASGDCNLDGVFDILDIGDFAAANRFNGGGGGATWSEGDFTYDGLVDVLDVADMIAADHYGTPLVLSTAATIAVPEPATAWLLTVAAAAGAARFGRPVGRATLRRDAAA